MVIFSQEDHKIIADSICDFVNDMKNNMTCVGRSDDYVKTGPLMLLNATPSLIAELPHIKIQLDSYNFDLRPEGYFHFIDTTPLTLNMTRPYPGNPNMTKTNPTGPQVDKPSTNGKLFGKITTDMLTRNGVTTNLTDPEAYFTDNSEFYNSCALNGTVWNGTMCGTRVETFKVFPLEGYATFLIFPQKDHGQDSVVLGAPFLNDFYQVYNLEKNTIGLVPSVNTNPETADNFYYSSKPENVEEFDRILVIIICVVALILGAIFRNGVFQPAYSSTFAAINKPDDYAALEGGEFEWEKSMEY